MAGEMDGFGLDDVRAFFAANAEEPAVVEYLKSLGSEKQINPDLVTAYLQTVEGRALIQPMMDQRVTEAIKTHDEKSKKQIEAGIKAGIAAEMIRLNPSETPEQKRLRELEEKDRKRDEEWEREKLNGRIKELAFKEGIRPDFLAGINFGSFEEASLYVQNFKKEKAEIETAKVNELMASGYKPGSPAVNAQKKLDASKLSFEDAVRMELNGELDEAIS